MATDRSAEPGLEALADEDLMVYVSEGDARAFEVVYDRHSKPAFSLAYRMCGSRGVAEDVVQEAFISIWRSGARYDRTRGSVRTWVLGIVHNRGIDALRRSFVHEKRRASDEGIEERFEAAERTDDEVARRDEASSIRGMLRELPPEQQKVIELAYFGGFTHTEIADMLNAPIGTIKGRMRLGLEKLRHLISPEPATS
jgi:RNA polymerase sigma-70 factor (ECF subfamily)